MIPQRACLYIAGIFFLAGCAHDPPPRNVDSGLAAHRDSQRNRGVDVPTALPTFIEDDYARALAEAKAKHVPLFVDAWASWCHSCVSLKNYVFTDPTIADETSYFVWLSIDTENPKNEAFLAKFPNAVLPTLRVIDATTEHETWKWEGTLTATEMRATLDELRGARGKDAESIARREDADVMALSLAGNNEACASMASGLIGKMPNGTQRVDVAVAGTSCALELPKDQQQRYLPLLVVELQKITSDTTLPILADDRSGAFEALVDAGQATGETAAMRENAVRWATFLEGEAAKAKSPAERAVFDPHRLLAYLALGQPDRAVPMLQQSEKDFPNDFNPPARLARAFLEMGRVDDAISASDRALSLASGPRRVRIGLVKADALKKKGDVAGEKKTLEGALAFVATLPGSQASPKLTSALQDRLAKIAAGEAATKPGKKAPAKH